MREHETKEKRRDHMEEAGEQMRKGVKHLGEHHAEVRVEIERERPGERDHGKERG